MEQSTQNSLNDFINFSKLPVFSANDFYCIDIGKYNEIKLQGNYSPEILQKYESYGYVFIDDCHKYTSDLHFKQSEINFGDSIIRVLFIKH